MYRHLGLVALFLFGAPSWGAYSNYNSLLLGTAASGVGGAYTAGTEDASAGAYYNPASLGRMEGDSISGTATVYNKFDTSYEESADLLTVGQRINRGFFSDRPFIPWKSFSLWGLVPCLVDFGSGL